VKIKSDFAAGLVDRLGPVRREGQPFRRRRFCFLKNERRATLFSAGASDRQSGALLILGDRGETVMSFPRKRESRATAAFLAKSGFPLSRE